MKKVLKFSFAFMFVFLSLNIVFADLVSPVNEWRTPTNPVKNEVSKSILTSPVLVIVVGLVVAIAISALVILGLNKVKRDELKNEEMAFAARANEEVKEDNTENDNDTQE